MDATYSCALCLTRPAQTMEHVVPRSIGGGLELPILCKPCNDTLGHGIDAEALRSGPIQHAAIKLKKQVPWFWKAIGHGIAVESIDSDVPMQIEKETGEPQVRPHRDESGALWQPRSSLGKKAVRRSLSRQIEAARAGGGNIDFDIRGVVGKVMRLEDGEVLDVPSLGLAFVGKQDKGLQFKTGTPLSHRYPARIAYFSLVAVGADLKDASLENWRRYVRGEIADPLQHGVIICRENPATPKPAPMHSVRLDDIGHGAFAVDIMLFGCWTWRCVFFLRQPPQLRFFAYAVDLGNGDAIFSTDEEELDRGLAYPIPAPHPELGWGRRR